MALNTTNESKWFPPAKSIYIKNMKTKDEQFEPELEVVIDWQTGRFWFVKKEECGKDQPIREINLSE